MCFPFCAPVPKKYRDADEPVSLKHVRESMKLLNLNVSSLIIGIDYHKSNLTCGMRSNNTLSLHHTSSVPQRLPAPQNYLNPYELSILAVGESFPAHGGRDPIHVFGFGDAYTSDYSVFSFFPDRPCLGLKEVLDRYQQITPFISMDSRSSFAPIIRKAIDIVRSTGKHHVLLIISTGQPTDIMGTINALVDASYHHLSIILVGVGDGPFNVQKFEAIRERRFNNFSFVSLEEVQRAAGVSNTINLRLTLASRAFREITEQHTAFKNLGLPGDSFHPQSEQRHPY